MSEMTTHDFRNDIWKLASNHVKEGLTRLPDVTLVFQNNETMHLNKSVLVMISPMIRSIMSDNPFNVLLLPEIAKESVEKLINLFRSPWEKETQEIDVDCMNLLRAEPTIDIIKLEKKDHLKETSIKERTSTLKSNDQEKPKPNDHDQTIDIEGDYDEIDEVLHEPMEENISSPDVSEGVFSSSSNEALNESVRSVERILQGIIESEEEVEKDEQSTEEVLENAINDDQADTGVNVSSEDEETIHGENILNSNNERANIAEESSNDAVNAQSEKISVVGTNESTMVDVKRKEKTSTAEEHGGEKTISEENKRKESTTSYDRRNDTDDANDDIDYLLEDDSDDDKPKPPKVTKLLDVEDIVKSFDERRNQATVACIIDSCGKTFEKKSKVARSVIKQRIENHLFSQHPSERTTNAFKFSRCTLDNCGKRIFGKVSQKKHVMERHNDHQQNVTLMIDKLFSKKERGRPSSKLDNTFSGSMKDHIIIPSDSEDEDGATDSKAPEISLGSLEKIQNMVEFSSDSSSDDEA